MIIYFWPIWPNTQWTPDSGWLPKKGVQPLAMCRASPASMVAKVEWHPGELFLWFGFVVTNLPMELCWIIRFCNHRGTAEQQI